MRFSALFFLLFVVLVAAATAMPQGQWNNNKKWKNNNSKPWKKNNNKKPWQKNNNKPVHKPTPPKPVHKPTPPKPVHKPTPPKPTKPIKVMPIKPAPFKPTRILTKVQAETLKQRIKDAGGCNGNICFAIDGSGSMPPTEFTNEKNFVLDLVSIISVDTPVEVAAVQYATANTKIHKLTPDIEGFNLAVEATQQMKGKSFLIGGVNYCFSQLWRRRNEAIKMIILGDGESNIGGDAVKRADLFRRIGGDVSVVAAGFKPNDEQLLKLAGGDEFKVFEVTSFFDVLALQGIIEDLVEDVCGL